MTYSNGRIVACSNKVTVVDLRGSETKAMKYFISYAVHHNMIEKLTFQST